MELRDEWMLNLMQKVPGYKFINRLIFVHYRFKCQFLAKIWTYKTKNSGWCSEVHLIGPIIMLEYTCLHMVVKEEVTGSYRINFLSSKICSKCTQIMKNFRV